MVHILSRIRLRKPKDLKQGSTSQPGCNLLYPSCDELPYSIFKKCATGKEYHLLGTCAEEDLENAWVKLYSEFCLISGDESIKAYVHEWAQLTILESKVLKTKLFVSMLFDGYNEAAAEQLKALGYNVRPGSLESDIDKVLAKLTNHEATIKNLIAGIKKKQPQETKQPTSADFDERLNEYEEVFKVSVNMETLTAQMYGLKLKRLREYCQKQEING